MTAHVIISDENAESIGRPIFDKIIRSFLNEDRDEFVRYFPYLDEWMTVEVFDEAVVVLNRLGELLSSEYSSYSVKDDRCLLLWKVEYKNDQKKVHWNLHLEDSQGEIKVNGFEFDR